MVPITTGHIGRAGTQAEVMVVTDTMVVVGADGEEVVLGVALRMEEVDVHLEVVVGDNLVVRLEQEADLVGEWVVVVWAVEAEEVEVWVAEDVEEVAVEAVMVAVKKSY